MHVWIVLIWTNDLIACILPELLSNPSHFRFDWLIGSCDFSVNDVMSICTDLNGSEIFDKKTGTINPPFKMLFEFCAVMPLWHSGTTLCRSTFLHETELLIQWLVLKRGKTVFQFEFVFRNFLRWKIKELVSNCLDKLCCCYPFLIHNTKLFFFCYLLRIIHQKNT